MPDENELLLLFGTAWTWVKKIIRIFEAVVKKQAKIQKAQRACVSVWLDAEEVLKVLKEHKEALFRKKDSHKLIAYSLHKDGYIRCLFK